MKFLFVCAQNVGRSQMAAALYNKYTDSHDADSAGTNVQEPGQTIRERCETSNGARHVVELMAEEGIDILDNIRRPVTPDMVSRYDRVIVMAEPDITPEWLRSSPNFVYWEIMDPRFLDMSATRQVKDDIILRVQKLIAATPVR